MDAPQGITAKKINLPQAPPMSPKKPLVTILYLAK